MAALVSSSIVNFPNDPYLQYQPAFAYTLPVQLLCAGVTLTLLVVLGIHLLCESRYGDGGGRIGGEGQFRRG
jgi:hypothetical protein